MVLSNEQNSVQPSSPLPSNRGIGKQQYRYSPGSGNPSTLSQQPSSRAGRNSGAFYGMLRKTRRKTYTALRGGGRKHNNNVNLTGDRGEGGEMVEYSSSDSDAADLPSFSNGSNRATSRGVQAARSFTSKSPFTIPRGVSRSPFTMPHGVDGNVEPVRSFYYSPHNSWHDGDGQHNNNAGTFPQQQQQQQQSAYDNDAMSEIVRSVECNLRQAVLCCAMFIAGAMMPERMSVAQHALELSLVAWGTCLFIVTLGWFQGCQFRREATQQTSNVAAPPPSTPMVNNLTRAPSLAEPPRIERLERKRTSSASNRQEIFKFSTNGSAETLPMMQTELSRKRSHNELVVELAEDSNPPSQKIMRGTKQPIDMPKQQQQRKNVHPQLDNLFVMMVGKRERIFPNSVAYDMDNDLFSGRMLLMFRTPDVDETTSSSSSDPVVEYFRRKQRRFEFQWQFRLKKLPPGDVFLGCELEEPIKMGMIQRAVSNTALKFVKKMNQGFTYVISDSAEDGPSYLSFPVGTSMDRFNAARPGEPLPVLGKEVVEDAESMKLRKRGAQIEWNTESTYTMALWSAYVDWIDWQILNFPGIRPFSVSSVAGVQPIILTLYTNSSTEGTEKNPKRDIVLAMEVSNVAKSVLGSEAKKWIEEATISEKGEEQKKALEAIVEPLELSEAGSLNENGTFEDEEDEEDVGEQFEPLYDDACDVEDLEEDDEGVEVDEMALDNIETGAYLLSGASISLREGTGNYVASGGGFAVLQSSPTSCIVLEKIQTKKKKGAAAPVPSMMIRSGDVLRVKLVEVSSKAVKHLSLHRGWWLRWSSTRPKRNNGLFYIRTAGEPTGSLVVLGGPFSLVSRRWSHYLIGACVEGSAKYGGRVLGIYKTGKNAGDYDVLGGDGVGEEDDIGPTMQQNEQRMMPLLLCAENFGSLRPSTLSNFSAEDYSSPSKSPTRSSKLARQISVEDVKPIPILGLTGTELLRYEIDVPAWLEVMDRTKRTKQFVYAVRVKETVLSQNYEPAVDDSGDKAGVSDQSSASTSRVFMKLRTGRDLAPILRLGVDSKRDLSPTSDQWQQRFDFSNQDGLNDADSSSSSSDDSDSDEELDEEPSHFLIAGPNHSDVNETPMSEQNDLAAKVFPDDQDQGAEIMLTSPTQHELLPNSDAEQDNNAVDGTEKPNSKGKGIISKKRLGTKMKRERSIESDNAEEYSRRETSMSTGGSRPSTSRMNSETSAAPSSDLCGQDDLVAANESKKKSKRTAVMRVAKTVKASTVVTGKHVIKHSKNLGKGTVSAGRAAGRVIPVSSVVYNPSKPPRKHEPGGRVHRKRSDRGQMKMIGRAIKNIEGQGNISTPFLAGQLLPPDQNCRKISQILSNISNTPNMSAPVLDAISSLATTNSAQDLTFLRGSSAELGVKPLKPVDSFDINCVVARCVYSGRWREELCVVYTKGGSHLAFYAPLAKKPSLVVSFEEIISARKCHDDEACHSALPGFSLLSIDTAWKCHYIAFLENTERESFLKRLNEALFYTNAQPNGSSKVAQEYESYRMSLETSLTGTVGKWRAVSMRKKKQTKQRRILNGRRMAFDITSVISDEEMATKSESHDKIASYVENLLRMALSFSPEALDATDLRFMEFLDETSRLRTLPLHEIDLSSKEAFCIFVNLYHCLLQHSLLLAVDGLPNKRSVMHFKRCSCYEIGEDVFSLAELECCVIRDKAGVHIKPPFVGAAKKSRAYQMMYGLGSTDPRINFILNNGDMAYPSAVPVLRHQTMDDQMDAAASCLLTDQVKIDKRKRTVYLPKVCDVYRMGDGLVSLSQCLNYLEEVDQLAIDALLDGGVVSVKFNRNCEEFHPNLTELH